MHIAYDANQHKASRNIYILSYYHANPIPPSNTHTSTLRHLKNSLDDKIGFLYVSLVLDTPVLSSSSRCMENPATRISKCMCKQQAQCEH